MYSTVVWGIYLTEHEDYRHRVFVDCRDRLLGSVQTIVRDCTDVGVWSFPNGFWLIYPPGVCGLKQLVGADFSRRIVADSTTGGCRVYIQGV
jgi:hypothetical protein